MNKEKKKPEKFGNPQEVRYTLLVQRALVTTNEGLSDLEERFLSAFRKQITEGKAFIPMAAAQGRQFWQAAFKSLFSSLLNKLTKKGGHPTRGEKYKHTTYELKLLDGRVVFFHCLFIEDGVAGLENGVYLYGVEVTVGKQFETEEVPPPALLSQPIVVAAHVVPVPDVAFDQDNQLKEEVVVVGEDAADPEKDVVVVENALFQEVVNDLAGMLLPAVMPLEQDEHNNDEKAAAPIDSTASKTVSTEDSTIPQDVLDYLADMEVAVAAKTLDDHPPDRDDSDNSSAITLEFDDHLQYLLSDVDDDFVDALDFMLDGSEGMSELSGNRTPPPAVSGPDHRREASLPVLMPGFLSPPTREMSQNGDISLGTTMEATFSMPDFFSAVMPGSPSSSWSVGSGNSLSAGTPDQMAQHRALLMDQPNDVDDDGEGFFDALDMFEKVYPVPNYRAAALSEGADVGAAAAASSGALKRGRGRPRGSGKKKTPAKVPCAEPPANNAAEPPANDPAEAAAVEPGTPPPTGSRSANMTDQGDDESDGHAAKRARHLDNSTAEESDSDSGSDDDQDHQHQPHRRGTRTTDGKPMRGITASHANNPGRGGGVAAAGGRTRLGSFHGVSSVHTPAVPYTSAPAGYHGRGSSSSTSHSGSSNASFYHNFAAGLGQDVEDVLAGFSHMSFNSDGYEDGEGGVMAMLHNNGILAPRMQWVSVKNLVAPAEMIEPPAAAAAEESVIEDAEVVAASVISTSFSAAPLESLLLPQLPVPALNAVMVTKSWASYEPAYHHYYGGNCQLDPVLPGEENGAISPAADLDAAPQEHTAVSMAEVVEAVDQETENDPVLPDAEDRAHLLAMPYEEFAFVESSIPVDFPPDDADTSADSVITAHHASWVPGDSDVAKERGRSASLASHTTAVVLPAAPAGDVEGIVHSGLRRSRPSTESLSSISTVEDSTQADSDSEVPERWSESSTSTAATQDTRGLGCAMQPRRSASRSHRPMLARFLGASRDGAVEAPSPGAPVAVPVIPAVGSADPEVEEDEGMRRRNQRRWRFLDFVARKGSSQL